MIPVDLLAAFFAISVLLALSPGPDNLFVLTQSAMSGPRAGLAVTLGLCTGLIVHTTAVAVGVAAIVQASAVAYTAIKLAGAGYLLYLAWLAFTAAPTDEVEGGAPRLQLRRLYGRGIIMNVTNPKVSIFFLAFLPQFADPARGSLVAQILLLGAVFAVATVVVFGGIAVFAGAAGRWLASSARAQLVLNRVAGTVFIVLALNLIVTVR
ncbi:MAG: LysE family translocator [Woeseiaceae bacterium]|nr:LysE family translocator [Woeseiaceae bacterium]